MNILLDYDGTIHNTMLIYIPAIRNTFDYLVKNDLANERVISEKEISGWLGLTPKEMWDTFMPSLSKNTKDLCIKMVGNYMSKALENGSAHLYSDAFEALTDMKKAGHNLIFLSNCTHKYMEDNRRIFNLDQYYKSFYCSEDFGYKEKYEIFKSILADLPGEYIVVGDRYKDIEIKKYFDVKTIGCLYGYGSKEELEDADYKALTPSDIGKIVESIA